jgi:hypothetical protein
MDVTLQVVDRDERLAERIGQGLGVADADQQGSREARALGYGDGIEVCHGHAGLTYGRLNHRHNGAEVLAGGELRDDAAVGRVDRDLGGHYVGESAGAAGHHGGGGLVAGALDPEDETPLVWCIHHVSTV